jgi:signal transduction histidine kinase/DNA-binding response OmpR family regulator
MRSKCLLELIAGHTAVFAILLLVLLLSIVGAPLLQQKKVAALRMGADIAITKAYAVSEALLAGVEQGVAADADTRSFIARHYRTALNGGDIPPAYILKPEALETLRGNPQRPVIAFTSVYDVPHLIYTVHDKHQGLLVLDLPLERERALMGRFFGQSYLSSSTVGYLLIGLLLIGSFGLRQYLRGIAGLPIEERRSLVAAALQDQVPGARRNLLPWMLALCAAVFSLDATDYADWAIGIGYVLAVTLTLSSNRSWHITAVAAVATLLLVISPILAPYSPNWWQYLQNHSAIIFAILITGLYGSANMRKTEGEAIALAEATRARMETSELRNALQRAEAAENERSQMVERLSMANQAAGISMWEWDLKTDTVTLTGGTSFGERLEGRTSYSGTGYAKDYLHPEDRDAWEALFIAAIESQPRGNDRISQRYRAVLPDGRMQHVQMHARLLRSPKGRVSKILGVDWEVTREELAKLEIAHQAAALQDARDRFERAVAGAQDALFEFNLRTGEEWYSPQLLQMLGYDAAATEHPRFEGFVDAEDLPKVQQAFNDHLQSGTPYDVEYRLCQRDGERLRVRSRGAVSRDADAVALWFAGSIADVSHEWLAREAIMRAAMEAETASKAKSTFLATMSHEIRTPMNGIIGMTGLLLDGGLDRVQRDYAETIRSSADSLLTILNDILDFSKIEAGKLDIESIELDLVANVDEVGSIMAFQAAAKGLELVVNVRPEVPGRVLGDPQRIRQCLINLVGNAIKFTQRGEVVLEVCTVGQQSGRALVHFEVRDTGIGIESGALQTLFQPFIQADSSTTRKFGGTGLGLSIVRRLVEMMGGRAGAHSEVGSGSTFWFTLPLEPASGVENVVRLPATAHGRRVLLVDDNEANRRVLASQMMHAGYEVMSAPSAAEALDTLRRPEMSFDVVILDYQMPDMDGATLGEQIVKSREIRPARLVLLTSLDRSGDMQRFADIGFSAYLTKPVRTRELLDCLQQSLSRNAEEWQLRSQPMITRGTLIASDTRRQYSGTVLLVEDNPINQRVARRFLERLGCEVQVVNDGQQGVDAFLNGSFSVILMDMQMPVMDGVEATQRIRKLEGSGPHTPIVALTANAMMGTLERCLEAGMDDYLTKPLDISRLQDVLDRFMASRTVAPTQTAVALPATVPIEAPTSKADANADVRARIAEIAGDDVEFILELMGTFLQASTDTLRDMRAAVLANDYPVLAQAAHKLKGACANLHIHSLTELAQVLETLLRSGGHAGADAALDQITEEFERIAAGMRSEIAALAAKQVAQPA